MSVIKERKLMSRNPPLHIFMLGTLDNKQLTVVLYLEQYMFNIELGLVRPKIDFMGCG